MISKHLFIVTPYSISLYIIRDSGQEKKHDIEFPIQEKYLDENGHMEFFKRRI